MKKIALVVFSIFLLVGLGFVYINSTQPGFVQEIVNQATPPKKDIKSFLPQGSALSYPLNIERGYSMGVFADVGSGKPRMLALDPIGNIVVSITNQGKVVALPDTDNDGVAEPAVDILTGLDRPHGIAFDGQYIYVAETDKVTRYFYNPKTFAVGASKLLFSLPSGGGHYTRTIKIHGDELYVTVGSSCNVCLESEDQRAAMLVSNLDGSSLREFASGLRNTVFFDFDNKGQVWGNDMGRDNLGDHLPPDELNVISTGSDYGWPYCYGNKIRDEKFESGNLSQYCIDTKAPAFEYPAHVAPLGITFIDSNLFPSSDQGNLLVAFHGSWNSSVPVGYKIVKLSFYGGVVTSMTDFISGFIQGAEVLGRPVDLMFDREGYLYITDDKSGLIYVVSKG